MKIPILLHTFPFPTRLSAASHGECKCSEIGKRDAHHTVFWQQEVLGFAFCRYFEGGGCCLLNLSSLVCLYDGGPRGHESLGCTCSRRTYASLFISLFFFGLRLTTFFDSREERGRCYL